jgi:hypothetical protein
MLAAVGWLLNQPKLYQTALDLLESKSLPDGGFPAEKAYYQATSRIIGSGRSLVNWGGVSCRHLNEWVTVDALAVLKSHKAATSSPMAHIF